MNFDEQMKKKISLIDNRLEEYMRYKDGRSDILVEAMSYSLSLKGKRIRPILLLAACEAFGGNIYNALPFACAIEMIHTYSLIHDDLPAMDNDDYRRGMLTNHKVYGEDIAILAGDGLLSYAFDLMLKEIDEKTDISYIKAALTISEGAGIKGMVRGQVVDVISEGKKIDRETLDFIHENKTAAMIKSAVKCGAIIGGADDFQSEKVSLAAEKIGIAFQIKDDILDVTSTYEELGKPINSDEKNEKTTYITMFGKDKSLEIVEKLSKEAIEVFESLGENGMFLTEIAKQLVTRVK